MSLLCVLLVVISPVPFHERNDVPLRPGFSILYLIIPFATIFTSFSVCPSIPSPHFQCSTLHSFMPQPCLSCSRFSFCWLVLIGLKWVTSSITQSFKPPLNVSVSWGSGSIHGSVFPPSGSPPDRWRNPRPDGVAKVWPQGKSVGLCQHSLQCTQRPQDQ